jgi:CRISPR system Cascade subunit CasC
MSSFILDIHILQTVPPSNLNRDDTGTPKSAVYGGVRRARVSSQAWKRATRKAFEDLLPASDLGVRTRKVAEALAERIAVLDTGIGEAAALDLAAEVLRTATGSKIEAPKRAKSKADAGEEATVVPESAYLMFLSRRQLDALAALAVEGAGPGGDDKAFAAWVKKDREHKARCREAVDTRHSVDIALFGRMVADSADLNVEAATQVAHALSVHRSEVESDYYTAVDDRNADSESGAGMIGTVDFNSATLYRYAAVDVNALHANLGAGYKKPEEAPVPAAEAAAAFVEAFVTSLPTGKINTFGNHTLPAVVIVKVRSRRPISFVEAFESPVRQGSEGGFLAQACARLATYVPQLESAYGVAGDGEESWVVRVGDDTAPVAALGTEVRLPGLLAAVKEAVNRKLGTAAAGSGA